MMLRFSGLAMLSRFRALPRADRRLVLEAIVCHVVIAVALRILPFRAVRRLVCAAGGSRGAATAHSKVSPARLIWAVEASGRVLGRAGTCLSTALTGAAMLRRSGFPAVVSIGVRSDEGGGFHAHAWVEDRGQPIIGHRSDTDFAVIVRLENAGLKATT